MQVSNGPDLRKVTRLTPELLGGDFGAEVWEYLSDARNFLLYYNWCRKIEEEYIGIFVDGIIGVFLFRILPAEENVDEWIWVVVGDVPSAYLTCDLCPNAAAALDGYIGAMSEWVDAATRGESVAELIPVNVPATKENGELLRKKLLFLDERVLSDYREDLSNSGND